MDGEAAAAGVLQLALVDVKQHARDERELAETHVEKGAVVAAGKMLHLFNERAHPGRHLQSAMAAEMMARLHSRSMSWFVSTNGLTTSGG
jgi:hypothetical protein